MAVHTQTLHRERLSASVVSHGLARLLFYSRSHAQAGKACKLEKKALREQPDGETAPP